MRTVTTVIGGLSLLLLAFPAGAQPAAPNTPASPSTAAPQGSGSAGMMGGMGMMGGQRGGGMGMMMGHAPMGPEDEDDRGPGPMRRGHHGREERGTPMQIIINIGPDNRVETEEHEWRDGVGRREGPMMGGEWRGRSMAEHVHAHLDYLHGQLQLNPEQQPAWDRFANAVQDAVTRMRSPPAGMAPGQTLEQRLAAREAGLNSRLEAIRAVRSALSDLTGALSDAQKRTLDEAAAAFMPGAARMRSDWQ